VARGDGRSCSWACFHYALSLWRQREKGGWETGKLKEQDREERRHKTDETQDRRDGWQGRRISILETYQRDVWKRRHETHNHPWIPVLSQSNCITYRPNIFWLFIRQIAFWLRILHYAQTSLGRQLGARGLLVCMCSKDFAGGRPGGDIAPCHCRAFILHSVVLAWAHSHAAAQDLRRQQWVESKARRESRRQYHMRSTHLILPHLPPFHSSCLISHHFTVCTKRNSRSHDKLHNQVNVSNISYV